MTHFLELIEGKGFTKVREYPKYPRMAVFSYPSGDRPPIEIRVVFDVYDRGDEAFEVGYRHNQPDIEEHYVGLFSYKDHHPLNHGARKILEVLEQLPEPH